MKFFIIIFCCLALHANAQTPTILISIDGFAAHYLNEYKPKHLLSLANKGVVTEGLIPSYPTKTFPNHLTLVTGKAPFEHGIVLNRFYDKEIDDIYAYGSSKKNHQWLKYPPIWTLLEQQNIPTAIYFWPESDKSFQHVLPSYYKKYDGSVSNETRFKQLIQWLKISDETKPQLLISYFSTIDSIGHKYGRNSPELADAITKLDQQLGDFLSEISTGKIGPVNLVIVSDHGMVKTGKENALLKSTIIPSWMDNSFKIIQDGTQIFIYDINGDQRLVDAAFQKLFDENSNNTAKRYDVFKKGNYPNYWKVNNNKSFVPDIILSAIPPTTFTTNLNSVIAETHGFETKYTKDLNGIFIATGPDFNQEITLEAFENTEVFTILSSLLSLSGANNTPVKSEVTEKVLRIKH
ncbi:ectonucleotide pyrophosphatase/phosphodiesterase [Thalassotalea piscium]|uniref:Putative AlkP superfamily pyrophosphatase or phosphodiesterase n=1 Tax=Thalassotalea piscium TaxID=1230533 RepID=A0A7X0NH76_9GAMM|nr:ectonucleotide pyrophosphatase/phosphodiesterase [Thalassotalea piscium]MBB6543246.1 putative AlkP superfamily pyrophosphatase or phosphodiesterase [Thalassotalea piscium]